jgi:hypothetical protein
MYTTKISSKHSVLAFLSLIFFLSACGDSPQTISKEVIAELSSGGPSRPRRPTVVLPATADWTFEAQKHNFSIPNYKDIDTANVVLQLLTTTTPLTADLKSNKPIVQLPFANYLVDKKALNEASINVNNSEFTGTIEVLMLKGKDTITVFEMQVELGTIVETVIGFDNNGKRYEAEGHPSMRNHGAGMRKPIIYLYPQQPTAVNVQLDLKGELTHTYPKYPAKNGWQVMAQPNGELLDQNTGKIYYSLFWEAETKFKYDLSSGTVVAGAETAEFLDKLLEKLGLNRREANEFITYWLPELEKNAYNLIHFSAQEYQQQAKLKVTPKPDTEIRIFMVYQPLDAPIKVAPQTFTSPARKGFTLVEWGGMVQEQPAN